MFSYYFFRFIAISDLYVCSQMLQRLIGTRASSSLRSINPVAGEGSLITMASVASGGGGLQLIRLAGSKTVGRRPDKVVRSTERKSSPAPAMPLPSVSSPSSWITAVNEVIASDRASLGNNDKRGSGGIVYMVATPIGNLADITLRAIRILAEVDIIACEDPKVTSTLLRRLSLPVKTLISYNKRNWKQRIAQLIESAKTQSVAFVR
jgi:hypothetical protein